MRAIHDLGLIHVENRPNLWIVLENPSKGRIGRSVKPRYTFHRRLGAAAAG